MFLSTLIVSAVSLSAMAQSSTSTTAASATKANVLETPGAIVTPATVIDQAKMKKKWSGAAYMGNWGGVAAIADGESSDASSSDFFLEAKRDIGNGQSLGLRVSAIRYATSDDNDAKLVPFDPQIMYRNKILASTVRFSIPVHEYSREIGRHELRYNGGMDLYTAGKFTTSLLLEGRAYAYTENPDGQLKYRTRDGFGFEYSVTDRFQPFVNTMVDVRWVNEGRGISLVNVDRVASRDPDNLQHRTWMDVGASIKAVPKVLDIYAYLTQARMFDSNTALLDEQDTSYNIEFLAFF